MLGLIIWLGHLEAMVAIGMAIFYASLSRATRGQIGLRPAALALAIPPIAFAMPKLVLLHVVYFMIVPVFANRRYQIVPTYIFALMLLPEFKSPVMIGPVYLFFGTIYDSLGLGALLTMLMRFPARSLVKTPSDIPFLIILLVMLFGRGRDTTATNFLRSCVEILLAYGIPYYIVSRAIKSFDDIKRVMLYMSCAAVMVSVVMFYETLRTWPLYRILYLHYGMDLAAMVKLRSGWLRATGTGVEATSMAFVLVPCFIATVCSRRAFASTTHYVGLLAVLGLGLLSPQSRGALVGLLFGITAMNLYLRRRASVVSVMFLAACLAGAMLIVPAESRLGSMLGKSADTVGTSDYRKDLLRRGMEEIGKRPLAGVSEAVVLENLADLKQGEGIIDFVNTYLYIALITGIIGLIAFAVGLGAQPLAFWRMRGSLSSSDVNVEIVAFVFAGLLTLMEMIAFTSLGGRPTNFLMMFIGFGAAMLSMMRQGVVNRAPLRADVDGHAAAPQRGQAGEVAIGEWREPFPRDLRRSL